MVIVAISAWTLGSPGQIMVKALENAAQRGHEVYVFAQTKDNYDTLWIPNYHRIGSEIGLRIHIRLATDTGLHGCFSFFSTIKLICELEKIKPDIIHLHNLHGWFLNLPLFFSWLKKKKIRVVWTLHDCWAFTGHCPHFEMEHCSKWKTGCFSCPRYKEYPASSVDQSRFLWKLKKKCFTGLSDAIIVTPSEWLANLVKQSYLKEYPVEVIHNGIDHSVFYPQENNFRCEHNLLRQFVILGVAFDWGFKKGLDVFIELRKCLSENYAIIIVGADDVIEKQLGPGFIVIHRTANKKELAEIYSAADVFINPTREDTFPTVNIEALACGTPVITFPTGGSPEIIDETCGIVTKEATSESMLEAILRLQRKREQYSEAACCNRAKKFDQNTCCDLYVTLYEEKTKNAQEEHAK